MSAPDYPAAAQALIELTRGHGEQHRCTDGTYYGPTQFNGCPINGHGTILLEALTAARQEAHTAVHDPDVVEDVAAAMLSTPLTELDPESQDAWRQLARLGLEEFCRLLDVLRAAS